MQATSACLAGYFWIALCTLSACAKQVKHSAKPPPVPTPTTELSPKLAIHIQPRLEPARIRVEIHAQGSSENLQRWSLLHSQSLLQNLSISDAQGKVKIDLKQLPSGEVMAELTHPPSPPLHIAYEVEPANHAPPLTTYVELGQMLAAGESLLLLPSAYEGVEMPIALTIATKDMYAPHAASSFGLGERFDLQLAPVFLRHASFFAGHLEWAKFSTHEGRDEAVLLGNALFDMRWVAAETAGVRASIDSYFGGLSSVPFVLLLHGKPHHIYEQTTSAYMRSHSLLVEVDEQTSWTATSRIPVAHALVHRWLGGRLRIGGPWFTEGVTRFVARHILFELGLLSSEEFVADLNIFAAELATSPFRTVSNQELERIATSANRHSDKQAAFALLVARGSTYALRLDHLIRQTSQNQHSLRDLLLQLMKIAADNHVTNLSLDVWRDEIRNELGIDEIEIFNQTILDGAEIPLPKKPLAPCFTTTSIRYAREQKDFELAENGENGSLIVISVLPNSPAEQAGLQLGDRVVEISRNEHAGMAKTIALHIMRGEQSQIISYRPRSTFANGIHWQVQKNAPPLRCR